MLWNFFFFFFFFFFGGGGGEGEGGAKINLTPQGLFLEEMFSQCVCCTGNTKIWYGETPTTHNIDLDGIKSRAKSVITHVGRNSMVVNCNSSR